MELFEDCQKRKHEYIIDFFDQETQNPKYWLIIYTGIEGTPYEKGLFKVKLVFPDDYPKSMPRAYFLTKIYHLNIKDPADGGNVCLENKNACFFLQASFTYRILPNFAASINS